MIKERTREKFKDTDPAPFPEEKEIVPAMQVISAVKKEKPHPREDKLREHLKEHKDDKRFQHELEEMKETHDLDDIDDDVEDEATLLEWHAPEHTHQPKSQGWFVALAAGATIIVGIQLLVFANIFGAITIAVIAGMTYYIAQHKPPTARYRVMLDGVAVNNTLFHYNDLQSFNIIYEPGETKTVILLSKRKFAPFIHMEIGDADPVEIRNALLEMMDEDQELDEPMADIIARRLGF